MPGAFGNGELKQSSRSRATVSAPDQRESGGVTAVSRSATSLHVPATRDESGVRFRTRAHLGQSKIEQLVLRVYSPVARCKQTLFKSTELNRARLTGGRKGNRRGVGGCSLEAREGRGGASGAWVAGGEAGKKKKLRSSLLLLAGVAYLWRRILREPATECIRRPQRATERVGVSVSGAQGG